MGNPGNDRCIDNIEFAVSDIGSGAADELKTKTAENARKRLRVIVPRHDGSGWDLPRVEGGQEKELPVP